MNILLMKAERLVESDRWVVNPLGIMHLATVARALGHQVTLLDLRVLSEREARQRLEAALASLPDVVGLSALTHQAGTVRRVAAYLRRRHPDVMLVAGGPLAFTDPDYLLGRAGVDACILGEGETTFGEFLEAVERRRDLSGVPGLALLREGKVTFTPPRDLIPDADRVPLPAWDLIDLERYARFVGMSLRRGRRASLQTSRGCPYHCTFCHATFGKRFRGRSPEHVLDELLRLRRDQGVRRFELIDDIFNAQEGQAEAILRGIRDRLPDCRISFPNGIRADRMTRAFVRLMREAGCEGVYIAIESASPRIQHETGKNLDVEQVGRVAAWLREERIHTCGMYMIGFPGETAEEIDATLSLARRIPVDLAFISVVIPYKNTRLWNEAVAGRVGNGSPEKIDPQWGFEGQELAAVPLAVLRERALALMRRGSSVTRATGSFCGTTSATA